MKSKSKMSKVIFGSLLALTFVLVTTQAHAQGTWETSEPPTLTLTPMPTPRAASAAGAINGKLYVVGGGSSALEVYDPAKEGDPSGPWETKAPMPAPPGSLAAAAAIGDKLYVVGGCNSFDCGSQTTGRLEVYDRAKEGDPSGPWETKTSMTPARHSMAAGAIDGKLYVVGGGTSSCCPALDRLQVYNPDDNMWTTLTPMPTPRRELAAGVIDGKLYVVGGRPGGDGSQPPVGTLEIFDPSAGPLGSWTAGASMPTARSNLAAGVIGGKLYVVGGSGSVLDTVEVYDPATDTWSTETSMPTARSRLAAVVIGGKLYTVGGDNGLDALEIFTPAGGGVVKEITSGPDVDGAGGIDVVVEVGLSSTTEYDFDINYANLPISLDVLIVDSVPAEWDVLFVDGKDVSGIGNGPANGTTFSDGVSGDSITVFKPGRGAKSKSGTKIHWTNTTDGGTINVVAETRKSPGKGHQTDTFAPTSCGPLFLNSGPARVFELDPATGEPLRDPVTGEKLPPLFESNVLCLAAVEDFNEDGEIARDGSGDEDGDGLSDLEEACTIGTDPCDFDTDGDTLDDGVEVGLGTDPLNPDTDGDGARDDVDADPLDPAVQ